MNFNSCKSIIEQKVCCADNSIYLFGPLHCGCWVARHLALEECVLALLEAQVGTLGPVLHFGRHCKNEHEFINLQNCCAIFMSLSSSGIEFSKLTL